MKLFKDLIFQHYSSSFYGKKARMKFNNGYGISVVSNTISYGGDEGLYEIAVLGNNGELVFDTPITNDVIGWLSENDVSRIMEEIQQLPAINN